MVGGKGPLTAEDIENEAGHFFVEEEPEAVVRYVNTVTTAYIETVAKGRWKIFALSYTLCGIKRRKNIKADGKSNLVSLADWLES